MNERNVNVKIVTNPGFHHLLHCAGIFPGKDKFSIRVIIKDNHFVLKLIQTIIEFLFAL